jgi:hypothetical protein
MTYNFKPKNEFGLSFIKNNWQYEQKQKYKVPKRNFNETSILAKQKI